MKKNMGNVDKAVRVLIAIIIGGLYFANIITGVLGVIALVLASVFILTSALSYCPLYTPFGLDTGANQEGG